MKRLRISCKTSRKTLLSSHKSRDELLKNLRKTNFHKAKVFFPLQKAWVCQPFHSTSFQAISPFEPIFQLAANKQQKLWLIFPILWSSCQKTLDLHFNKQCTKFSLHNWKISFHQKSFSASLATRAHLNKVCFLVVGIPCWQRKFCDESVNYYCFLILPLPPPPARRTAGFEYGVRASRKCPVWVSHPDDPRETRVPDRYDKNE